MLLFAALSEQGELAAYLPETAAGESPHGWRAHLHTQLLFELPFKPRMLASQEQ